MRHFDLFVFATALFLYDEDREILGVFAGTGNGEVYVT